MLNLIAARISWFTLGPIHKCWQIYHSILPLFTSRIGYLMVRSRAVLLVKKPSLAFANYLAKGDVTACEWVVCCTMRWWIMTMTTSPQVNWNNSSCSSRLFLWFRHYCRLDHIDINVPLYKVKWNILMQVYLYNVRTYPHLCICIPSYAPPLSLPPPPPPPWVSRLLNINQYRFKIPVGF